MTRKQQRSTRLWRSARPGGPGVSRREFIARSGAAVGGLALAPSLGVGSAWAARGGDAGSISVSNWPLYIDKKSLRQFERETGVDVKYRENINDNNELFAKIQEPLARGQGIGADIIVPTGWLVSRLVELEYIQKLPLDAIPNAANLAPSLQNPSWDPTGEYSLPWQSGMTGIAYNLERTDRELTSVDDLFDRKFKGKIGMLLEMRDTVALVLLADGVDPAEVTFRQAGPAFKRLEKAADNGQIRRFTGNDYQDELVNGDFAACVGWSGDVAQLTLENENLRFVIPDEGGHRWADTMVMVAPSERPDQVAAWMNYFYDPANAAQVTAFVQYLPTVAGIEDELAELDPDAATNPLIFPPQDVFDRLVQFKVLGPNEEEKFDERFAEITGA